MAGTFPDVPGYRMPYDVDGTSVIGYLMSGGTIYTFTSSTTTKMNADTDGGIIDPRPYVGGSNYYVTFLFPEPRTITGYFLSTNPTSPSGGRTIATSTNTTTGQNGTWTIVESNYPYIQGTNTSIVPVYRSAIQTANWTNITGIRFAIANTFYAMHLYGDIPNAGSPDRLRVVDTSNSNIAAQLDFGDIMQRNNVTKQFKVVNNSSTKTANNITVALSTLSDASPTLIGQYQISTDNTTFANAINIGSLAPGASSGTLYVKLNVSPTAQLGPWALRITATANSWT